MNFAIALTIFASLLWGITNHIDKFMINGIDESGSSVKTLLVFSSLIAGLVFSPIWLIICEFSVSISTVSLISIFSSSIIYIFATYLYFKALDKNDTSVVAIMFQMIPVFSYALAFVLFKEVLTLPQMVGSLIIILSAVLISFDFEHKDNKNKFKALFLMALSSLFYAIYYIMFDIAIRNSTYNSCAFWYQIGFLIIGLILISIKSFRTTFIKAIKNNGKKYFSLNITNEILNLIACLLVNFANVTIPIALANISNGFQVIFVFVLGILGTKFLPKYFKESITKKALFQKLGCIVLSLLGLCIIFI